LTDVTKKVVLLSHGDRAMLYNN